MESILEANTRTPVSSSRIGSRKIEPLQRYLCLKGVCEHCLSKLVHMCGVQSSATHSQAVFGISLGGVLMTLQQNGSARQVLHIYF